MLWFFLGLFVGATLGALGMGILAGGKRREDLISSSRLRSDRYSGGVQSLSQDREEKEAERFLNYILDKHHDGERWPLE